MIIEVKLSEMNRIECDFNENNAWWYIIAMHVDFVFTAPIFLCAVVCIVGHSPKAMSNYRLHLLNNVVWSVF